MQKTNNIQCSLSFEHKRDESCQRLSVLRSGYCLTICFICCLSLTVSCLAQSSESLIVNDKKSPLLSLLDDHKAIIERQAANRNLQQTLQEDISNLSPIIGIKWVPDVKFLITCISPIGQQKDFQNPYLKLYVYRPDENRLTLRAQSDIFVLPSYHAITRFVARGDTVFFFPLRAPKQFEQLSPVYRLVRGDLFVQPIRTIFQSAVLENAFFAVVKNGDDETRKLSILNGKKQLTTQMKLPIALPDNYLDIELVKMESTMSGILGEPIEQQSGADWRFKRLWFYRLQPLDKDPNKLSPHEFKGIEPLPWLKDKSRGRNEGQKQINEEISLGLPIFGDVKEGQIFYWQHRRLSSSWEDGETLIIHELLEWNKAGEIRLLDILIEYNHDSKGLLWTLGKQGKLIRVPLLHTPIIYERLDQAMKFIIAADPDGKSLLYVKGNKLIGLANR